MIDLQNGTNAKGCLKKNCLKGCLMLQQQPPMLHQRIFAMFLTNSNQWPKNWIWPLKLPLRSNQNKPFKILIYLKKSAPCSSLLTISRTSTDAERVFSIAGNICNKTRTRLGDDAMNALVFLKHFLLPQY